jgi:hypothetical protein
MSIPLDRLYQYIQCQAQQIWQDRVLIYRFYPHGSKDFHDLSFLTDDYTLYDLVLCPYIYCNDQEPLNWSQYEDATHLSPAVLEFGKKLGLFKQNLRDYPVDIWDWALLLHSEQGGHNLDCYTSNGFVPVYYWSHAIIARDWFRYAQHVTQQKQSKHKFLIYNRDNTGTRQYRLKFADLLVEYNLVNDCKTWIGQCHSVDTQWQPVNDLTQYFNRSRASSNYSADFDLHDYETTEIEIVLETLFDDDRVHLTEKTLRPIALGQPFVLASSAGSLTYLKNYGFETFDSVWSEEYDTIKDARERLHCVMDLMKQIANWTPEQHEQRLLLANQIAQRNRERFFSQEFQQQILKELSDNLTIAFEYIKQHNTSARWMAWYHTMQSLSIQEFSVLEKSLMDHGDTNHFVSRFTKDHWKTFVTKAKTYYNR